MLALGGCGAGGSAGRPEGVPPALRPEAVATPPISPTCADRSRPEGDIALDGVAVQGGVVRGIAPRCATRLMLDGADVPVAKDGHFLIAFDRDAASGAILRAELDDGRVVERSLSIAPGNWRIERVNASRTAGVSSEAFMQRRLPELERIKAARSVNALSDGWRQAFEWPVKGRISGLFGAQRIYRGEPGSYHSGVDVAVPTGTPFSAPADGVVVLAADTPFTLEGYLLIIDHGMGLNSAFLHCSSLSVKQGDVVRRGQILGAVGATGRTSGPHMHWGMMWNGVRIDPLLLAGTMKSD
ncbi:MAG: M23 family metallopeptidase [Sphingobium sp.]|nr:M23 family metallopeptidase [Sphingobium sp.]